MSMRTRSTIAVQNGSDKNYLLFRKWVKKSGNQIEKKFSKILFKSFPSLQF